MKKALALVLALVLALSMAVSAFAATLDMVELIPAKTEESDEIDIKVYDESVLKFLVYEGGEYYIALDAAYDWENIELTSNGNVTAELVEYDPAKMNVYGMEIVFDITRKGDAMDNGEWFTSSGVEGEKSTVKYEEALAYAKKLNAEGHPNYADEKEVTYYGVEVRTNVNIIKLTVEDNYTAHYTAGTVKVEATGEIDGEDVDVVGVVKVINVEYEEVKWTANNFNAKYEKSETLTVNQKGYSDYDAAQVGYDVNDEDYEIEENRKDSKAAVISTTAFRAIEGKDIRVDVVERNLDAGQDAASVKVALYDIVKGQKGVNFQGYVKLDFVDEYPYNEVRDDNEVVKAIEFGFNGDQVVKGAYEITLTTTYDWFELRELFGLKVEEDDVISYYLVDENGKVVGGKEVDYMTADLDEDAEFTIKGENGKLGQYKIVLEVPAAEVGEANPNTGAESVVGVVAALAVVSVATAAAVSLKK